MAEAPDLDVASRRSDPWRRSGVAALSSGARHAITDAVGLVLLRCRREGMAFWGWPEETWVDLIGTTVAKFRSTRPGRRIGSAPVVLSGKVSHR